MAIGASGPGLKLPSLHARERAAIDRAERALKTAGRAPKRGMSTPRSTSPPPMSAKPPQRFDPQADRHPAPAKRGSLRWVRAVLGRSLRLEQPRQAAALAAG